MGRRVVVTGIGMVTPVGKNVDETWESLRQGRSGVGYISLFDASTFATQIAAEVRGKRKPFCEPIIEIVKRMDLKTV